MSQPCCLVVDDEADIRELLAITLQRMNIDCVSAENLQEGYEALARRGFDLCLTDMRLPDGNGIELVAYIQKNHPALPVAIITAHGSMEAAIAALKAGAFDFISKPVSLENLRNVVKTALKLSDHLPDKGDTPVLVGDCAAMVELRQTINKLGRSQAPVYIKGESGTGKELVARLIHSSSPRADKPFVPVNCGAIPSELMESEFFGHKKGSFTGAASDKQGLFQAAHGGTLFLDEVADLPLSMQVKLLRAIQEKQIRPVGAQKEVPVDARIVSATHKDLASMVRNNEFRQDLYYRINVIEVQVPPLRERVDDIELLARTLLKRLGGNLATPRQPKLSKRAIQALQHYAFPGNVRELENILERAMALCESDSIDAADLQLPEAAQANAVAETPPRAKPGKAEAEEESEAKAAKLAAEASYKAAKASKKELDPMLDEVQRQTILDALARARWNRTKAAELLGIGFRLQKLGLDKDPEESAED
jgi:two-component system response regulator PilR (NtrC family)